MNTDIRKLLEGVSEGSVSIDEALLKLKTNPRKTTPLKLFFRGSFYLFLIFFK